MAATYGEDAISAKASIKEAGLVVILKRLQDSAYNPETGADAAEVFDSFNVAAVVLPATLARFRGIDNKLVESGELVITKARYLLMSTIDETGAQIPEPEPEMQVSFFEKLWRVNGCSPINPAGTPILYQVGVTQIG